MNEKYLINILSFAGRILNRFSRDIGYIDETLPDSLFDIIMVALILKYFLIF